MGYEGSYEGNYENSGYNLLVSLLQHLRGHHTWGTINDIVCDPNWGATLCTCSIDILSIFQVYWREQSWIFFFDHINDFIETLRYPKQMWYIY